MSTFPDSLRRKLVNACVCVYAMRAMFDAHGNIQGKTIPCTDIISFLFIFVLFEIAFLLNHLTNEIR